MAIYTVESHHMRHMQDRAACRVPYSLLDDLRIAADAETSREARQFMEAHGSTISVSIEWALEDKDDRTLSSTAMG